MIGAWANIWCEPIAHGLQLLSLPAGGAREQHFSTSNIISVINMIINVASLSIGLWGPALSRL